VIKITKIVKEKDESIAQRLKKWQVLFSVTLAVFVSLFGFLFLFVTFGDKNDPDNKLFDSFVFYWALFSITAIFISLFMMIFYKNNNKDQLVFDSDNKSGQIAIQRFSWGAFGLGFLWGVYFKVYWLSLVWIAPLVLLFIFPRAWNFFLIAQCVNCFILGRKGAAIAYSRNKKLPAEKLLKSFRIWDNLAIIPSIVLLFIFFASILSILMQ